MTAALDLKGITAPLMRNGKGDFVHGSGPELLRSKILQVLLTQGASPHTSGEIPWRTGFGSALNLMRNQRNDEVLKELGRVYIRDALARWLPGLEITALDLVAKDAALLIFLSYRAGQQAGELTAEVPY